MEERWLLITEDHQWQLFQATGEKPAHTITMDDDTAWRLFTKNISEEEALERIKVTGNQELGNLIVKTVSYMK